MKRVLLWGLVMPAVLRRIVPGWFLESPRLFVVRHPWIALAMAVSAAGIGGLLLAVSGVVPVKASAGHWALTERLLQFAKRRSVSTHALFVSAPPLGERSLLVRGAGHYDLGCRPCHGTPRGGRPRVALAMLPPPPELRARIETWSPEELFYIVKHGLKFTGMPGWPTQQRDDEVWAVVAFLERLPALDEGEYLTLARGDPETTLDLDPSAVPPPVIVRESCARCHGVNGMGRDGAFPKLAGQRAEYLSRAMRAYRDGSRQSGIMASVASGLTAAAIDEAVQFYATRPPWESVMPDAARDQTAEFDRGRQIVMMGVAARDIPPCIECHGPSTQTARNPAYPRLAGQYAEYLAVQLELLKDRRRGGSEYVHLMHSFVDRLTPGDIRNVSVFLSGLDADPVTP